jgi:squalene-hopene/tetraprenyl-beta-curcumene cyclase
MAASRIGSLLAVASLALAGCGGPAPAPTPAEVDRVGRALDSAGRFLTSHQSADGAWRSDVYGNFQKGDALTPLVLEALARIDPGGESFRKGSDYLARLVPEAGKLDADAVELDYPVYTAAGAVVVLSRPENGRHRRAREAWLAYLRQLQLTEELGWQPTDREYGGWGYAAVRPRKPHPGELRPALLESNLSATAAALAALKAAACPADDPAFARALVFVDRCQNFADVPEQADADFDDGGFFFIYDDPVRNKAGPAGSDRHGRPRFASYGSTTADGLRALRACGRPADHPRVQAARRWLERHFQPDRQPGRFTPDAEPRRNAVYFYYAAVVADAIQVALPHGRAAVDSLAEDLLARQRNDGSWLNPVRASREDDPLVATSLAVLALARCRDMGQ